jgi:hypothetical protein
MKKSFVIFLSILSLTLFGQEKTYRLLYDFHQVYENKNNKTNVSEALKEELNKSHQIEVFANNNQSFIHLIDVISNSQANIFLDIKPEPNWYLIDRNSSKTFEKATNPNQKFKYLQNTIQTLDLKSTGEKNTILGIVAEEFKAETDEYYYTFWLGDLNGITASPVYFQFKNFVVLKAFIVFKTAEKNGGKREISYLLNNFKEQSYDFKKLTPKKFTTIDEYDKQLKQFESNEGVEKD